MTSMSLSDVDFLVFSVADDILFRQVPFDETSDCFLTKFNFETARWCFAFIRYRCVIFVVVVAKMPTAGCSLFTYFTTFIIYHFADCHQRSKNSTDNFSHFIHHDIK